MNFLSKFKTKLSKTSSLLSSNILDTFKSKKVDSNTLEELESILITSDISLDVVSQLIGSVQKINTQKNDVTEAVFEILTKKIEEILSLREKQFIDLNEDEKKLFYLLV